MRKGEREGGSGVSVVLCCAVLSGVGTHLDDGAEVASVKEPQNVEQELVWEQPQHRVSLHARRRLHLPLGNQRRFDAFVANTCMGTTTTATSPPTR